jgi:endonuclease YncB( thermonuclease family)
MKFILLFVSFFLIKYSYAIDTLSAKVVGVKDGDTYVILYNKTPITIRLEHVDCPEKKQPYGQVAKQFGSNFCFGKMVNVLWKGTKDRNGRIIGEIYFNNKCLNKELIKNGLAWHFKKYSKSLEYANLELEARKKKLGLWKDAMPIAPWEWRKL